MSGNIIALAHNYFKTLAQKSAEKQELKDQKAAKERRTLALSDEVARARLCFAKLTEGTITEVVLVSLDQMLSSNKLSYEALGPEGKKTNEEMFAEVNARARIGFIQEARIAFDNLSTAGNGQCSTDVLELIIRKKLQKAGAGYEVLDIEGKKTVPEIINEIQVRARKGDVDVARKYFERIGTSEGHPKINVDLDLMYINLKKANKDCAALDPEGKKTHSEMRKEINARVAIGYIAQARMHFADLATVLGDTNTLLKQIDSKLHEAGADYKVLDPTGQKTSAEMRTEINARVMARQEGGASRPNVVCSVAENYTA